MFRYENLSRNKRWLIFTTSLLVATILNVFDIVPDFVKGVFFGLVLALLLQEVVISFRAKQSS